jgi:hypothetical protein
MYGRLLKMLLTHSRKQVYILFSNCLARIGIVIIFHSLQMIFIEYCVQFVTTAGKQEDYEFLLGLLNR